jgi:hypothetical protein
MINKYIKYALAVIISVLGFSYTAQAAGRNGDGIVYHYSDCGQDGDQYNVRFYGFGGDGPGSACGQWVDKSSRMRVWSEDYNWSSGELINWSARTNAITECKQWTSGTNQGDGERSIVDAGICNAWGFNYNNFMLDYSDSRRPWYANWIKDTDIPGYCPDFVGVPRFC